MDSDDKKLSPMKFLPDRVECPWGSIEYRLADLGFIDSVAADGWLGGNAVSDIMQTYLERVVGDTAFEFYGTQFPVMVKRLSVKGKTSLHVNPDDETAAQRYDAFGKTALWYVTSAGESSRLYLGFRRDVTPEEFYRRCQDGTVEQLLNVIRPEKGQAFLIPPGMVHGAAGVDLLEIAECSELWFRLHDWGSPEREIHLEEAFDLIDFRAYEASALPQEPGYLARTPQFTVSEIRLRDALHSFGDQPDSFLVYVCAEGGAVVKAGEQTHSLKPGEIVLLPAEVQDYYLIPSERGTVLLEVRLEPRHEKDSYTQE